MILPHSTHRILRKLHGLCALCGLFPHRVFSRKLDKMLLLYTENADDTESP